MTIKITTDKGTFDVTQLVPTVKWSGEYQQVSRTLAFSLVQSPEDKTIPVVDCPLGAHVQMAHGGAVLFDGFIFSRTKATGSSALELTCFDRGIYLKRNKKNYRFESTTPEAAAAQLAAEFGITVGTLVPTGTEITRAFLDGSSLYEIITTLYTLASKATGQKYHVGFRADKLFVTVKEPDERTLLIRGKSNLIEAATTESVENMVNTVAIYDANGAFVRTVEDAQAVQLYGRMQEAVKQTKDDDKAAEADRLIADNGVTQKITIDCLGDVANVAGGTVVVQEPYTGLYGLFYIDSDVHEWKRGQYYNKLVLNFKNLMDEKEAGSLPNVNGTN